MATSGSTNWTVSRDDIIAAALRKCSSYDAANTIASEDITSCALALNAMVKEWMIDGLQMPLRREYTLLLIPAQKSYALGSTGDHFFASSELIETTIGTGGEALGQTTLTVTSSTGMAASDYALIVQDDGTILETTISSVPTSTSIVVNDALTAAAAAGNAVYTYTTKGTRPQKVLQAWRRDRAANDCELTDAGIFDYNRLPQKASSGTVTQYAYAPVIGNGTLYVWPVKAVSDTTDKIVLLCERLVEDFDSAADNPDFPVEWTNALIWGLASEIAFEYKVPASEKREIERVAWQKYQKVLDGDVEEGSVRFGAQQVCG